MGFLEQGLEKEHVMGFWSASELTPLGHWSSSGPILLAKGGNMEDKDCPFPGCKGSGMY